MKLYLVTSDSHGDIKSLKNVLAQYPMVDSIIHLGDYFKDALYLKNSYPDKTVHMIAGNCDANQNLNEKILEEGSIRIWLTHGHRYQVKYGLDRLKEKIKHEKYDVALFGHTHIPHMEKWNGCLLLNPGSTSCPRYDGPATFALLEVGNKRVEARIMEVL